MPAVGVGVCLSILGTRNIPRRRTASQTVRETTLVLLFGVLIAQLFVLGAKNHSRRRDYPEAEKQDN